ncbi:MAG: flagellar biosynthetic protein FliO [Bdellovibrionales bacterium]|nr:flagellar biosynthetic protein FliO [Bdellovibrionales bacterium]
MKHIKSLCFFVIMIFVAGTLWADQIQPELISSKANYIEGQIIAELKFNSDISDKQVSLDFINQTIQIDVNGASMADSPLRDQYNTKGVKSLYTYKNKNDSVRSRIIFNKPIQAKIFRDSVEIQKNNDTLKIVVHNPNLPQKNSEEEPVEEIKQPSSVKILPNDIQSITTNTQMVLNEDFKEIQKPNSENAMDSFEKDLERQLDEVNKAKANTTIDTTSNKQAVSEKSAAKTENKLGLADTRDGKKSSMLPENKIPLFSKKPVKAVSSESSVSKMLISLGVIIVFAFVMTIFLKWWSKKNTKSLDSTKIRVLTQHYLGPKKTLTIVQVAGESLLLGVTDHSINLIKPLSLIDDEVPTDLPNKFDHILEEFVEDKISLNSANKTHAPVANNVQEADEYSMASIKNIVTNKLKNMRPI